MSALDLACRLARGVFSLEAHARIPLEGVTALQGPSGAGKSSLLAAIAGLLRPAAGRIALGSKTLDAPGLHVPAERRRVACVFQEPRLFPHLTVAENLAYGAQRAPPEAAGPTQTDVVEALEIAALLPRKPAALSGGEARRAALARALLQRPRLLLLDEPTAHLDAARRARAEALLRAALARFAIPALYVTHDALEARRMSARVCRITDGRLEGPTPWPGPVRVTTAPLVASELLAEFEAGLAAAGAVAAFTGRVRAEAGAVATLTLEAYPGFTEAQIEALAAEARGRFAIEALLIAHRYGAMAPGETIVFVAAAAKARAEAFAAARWLIDRLKTEAPFWKREDGPAGARWVEPLDVTALPMETAP